MTFLFCFLSVRLEQVCASEARTRLLLRDRWGIKHWKAPGCTVCDLPCSCDNSPASSGNLDQSVESMNPHLPGVQDKISRPSQVGRDWRHEITFSVFDSTIVLSAANTAEKKSRRREKRKRRREGEFYFGHSSSLTSVRSRTSAATLVMRSPQSQLQSGTFQGYARVWQNYSSSLQNKTIKHQTSNFNPLLLLFVCLGF